MRPHDATVVAPRAWVRAMVWLGFPLVGAGAGWLLMAVPEWALSLPWVPFEGPIRLAASVPAPWASIGGITFGAAAGLLLALLSEDDYVTTVVDDLQVSMSKGESEQVAQRASVTAAFLDGKQFVLLGRSTEELVRQGGDLDTRRLVAALQAHGYPWHADGDPHRSEYRLWVADHPDLPAAAHALFTARARALEATEQTDAALLRSELARLDVVVADRDGRQFWRASDTPPGSPETPGDTGR